MGLSAEDDPDRRVDFATLTGAARIALGPELPPIYSGSPELLAALQRAGQELALVLSDRWPMSCVNPTVLPGSGLRRWQPYAMERGPNS